MELGRSVVFPDRCRRMRCQGVLGAWPRGAAWDGMSHWDGDGSDRMNGELGSMRKFHLYLEMGYTDVYWGCNPLILTIDPNFLRHPSGWFRWMRSCI